MAYFREFGLDDDMRRLMTLIDVVWSAGEVGISLVDISAAMRAAGRPLGNVYMAIDTLTYVTPIYEVKVPSRPGAKRRTMNGATIDRDLCPEREDLDRWLRQHGWPIDAWRAEVLDTEVMLPATGGRW